MSWILFFHYLFNVSELWSEILASCPPVIFRNLRSSIAYTFHHDNPLGNLGLFHPYCLATVSGIVFSENVIKIMRFEKNAVISHRVGNCAANQPARFREMFGGINVAINTRVTIFDCFPRSIRICRLQTVRLI